MFETIVVLTYAFIANIPLERFPGFVVSHYTDNANSLKIPLNSGSFVSVV